MIYTAIIGEKDKPRDDIKVFTGEGMFTNPRREARMYKTLFHHFIEDEYSIWVDGNVFLKHPEEWYYQFLEHHDIAVVEHAFNRNIYQEADLCLRMGKGEPDKLEEQIDNYDFDPNELAQTCIVIRRNTLKMQQLCEQWWAHICRYSVRDQISFPVVFHNYVNYLSNTNHDENQYFTRKAHNFEDQREQTQG